MISTARLTLRPFQEDDDSQLVSILGDPKVMAFSDHGALDRVATRDWLHHAVQSGKENKLPLILAICPRPMGGLIGYISLSSDPQRVGKSEAEIGFRLSHTHWCRGFATEAAKALIAQAKCLSGIGRLLAIVDPNNRQSVRVLEKIGMTYEAEVMFPGYDYPDHRFALDLDPTK